jgi:pimeloyl-ACP methyl ester carboxylesterase
MFITVGDAQLYTTAFGSRAAPPLLALSGWIGSWEDWADTLALLSEQWRTISFDHRGSGVSLAPVESITFDRLVDDVFAVLDAYEVERCVLAAMSMGASVALAAALRAPERFAGLVIVNGAYYRETPVESDPFFQVLQAAYPQAIERFIQACVPEADSEPIKHWGRQILGRATPEAAIALYRLAGTVDLRANLPRITQPTLVLHGDADLIWPLASSEDLAATLPNAQLRVIPGAGHVPIMTRPAVVAQAIRDFFGAALSTDYAAD